MCWNITKSCNPNKGTTSKGWCEILDINNGSAEVQSGAMALDKALKQLLASPSTMMWVHASALAKWTAQRMAVASACIVEHRLMFFAHTLMAIPS